jgi:hypothetical protein
VRDPVAQTCYLITGVTSNTTVKSSKREVRETEPYDALSVLVETVITLICHDWLQTAYSDE